MKGAEGLDKSAGCELERTRSHCKKITSHIYPHWKILCHHLTFQEVSNLLSEKISAKWKFLCRVSKGPPGKDFDVHFLMEPKRA